jgi:hypothetical protein
VTELILLPALYRERHGLETPSWNRERVAAMAHFAAAYTRADGTSPLWGDADDARALPLGGQARGDHRYLGGLVAAAWGDERARAELTGPRAEAAWLLGVEAAAALPDGDAPGSEAFRDGGVYVLRRGGDHVFVDCGPVGLAGRGGHGHNDALSFEAALDGVWLVADAGSYVYTASPEERNRFRSTRSHNTPLVDGVEQATLVPGLLWSLGDEASPDPRAWEPGPERDRFRGAHRGYLRLAQPVTPVRTIELVHGEHRLVVHDELEGDGEHEVEIPLLLAPAVAAEPVAPGRVVLAAGGRRFELAWSDPGDWELRLEDGWASPSYGVRERARRLVWRRQGPLRPLHVQIAPEARA